MEVGPPMAEFDRVARRYEKIHTANIAASGEDSYYFARAKLRPIHDYLAETGRPLDGLVFLDIGCGTGKIEMALAECFAGATALALDPSLESLQVAAARAGQGIRFICAGGEAVPLASDIADVALFATVLHHMNEPQSEASLKEARRVLKPGGLLFVFEHNPLNPLTRRAVSTCEFDKDATLLWPRQAKGLCRRAGWVSVRRRYTVFFPHFLRGLRFLERRLAWLPLGAQYVVIGTKG